MAALRISDDDRVVLEAWSRSRTISRSRWVRARIVLLGAQGTQLRDLARQLAISEATARLWLKRFEDGGLAALQREAPGRGRRPKYTAATVHRDVSALLVTSCPTGSWTLRSLSAALGISAATLSRLRVSHLLPRRPLGTSAHKPILKH